MIKKFEVLLLEEALDFIEGLDLKTRRKIYFNLDKASLINDPKLFRKLSDDIWEFRTLYEKQHYRLLAFWDKTDGKNTLVISTHGILKKVAKVPAKEIEKALRIRKQYFEHLKRNRRDDNK